MDNLKKLKINLLSSQGIDGELREDNIISKASKNYLEQLKSEKVKEKMKKGYLEMAKVNSFLAADSFSLENNTFFNYEERLVECD